MKNFVGQLITNYKKKTNGAGTESQVVAIPQQQQQALTYQECPQLGEHSGELLSLVCLEPGCIKHEDADHNILLCCICQEKFHSGHRVKPLKAVLRECNNFILSRRQADNKLIKIFDKEAIMLELTLQEEKVKEILNQSRTQVLQAFDTQQETIDQLFINLREQINAQQVSEVDVEHFQIQIYNNQQDIQQLSYNVKQLLEVLPSEKKHKEKNVETKDVLSQLSQINTDNLTNLNTMNTNVKKSLEEFQQQIAIKARIDLFMSHIHFSFSHQYKHANVTVAAPNLVKVSTGASGYKFAVMTPSLDGLSKPIKFGFKMKEVHQSNWLAIGMCHLDTIIAKNYTFSFSTLGHGAYMISSNGGSWSTTKSQQNNVVKTFKFVKNDTIHCNFDPIGKFLSFKMANSKNSYKLDYVPTAELLYPCVLFYYNNDEIEFIQPEEVLD